jgi:hypothetical protein
LWTVETLERVLMEFALLDGNVQVGASQAENPSLPVRR